MIAIRDWHDVPAAALAPLFEAEQGRWASELRWDTADAHAQIELARTSWGLPGRVAVDGQGRIHGLVYFLDTGQRIEVGGIIAGTAAVTGELLDAVLDYAGTLDARPVFCFAANHAPGLAHALGVRGFDVDPFIYFERRLDGAAGPEPEPVLPAVRATRGWTIDDLAATAGLLHRAYDATEGDWFAPGHTPVAWQQYLAQLIDYAACGAINPEASRCWQSGPELAGATLVTTISAGTAHLVQVAVDPSCRGAGLATALVKESCAAARRQGNTAMTLMVAGRNSRARALYASLGFVERAAFLAANRGYPLRLTSAAPATGGETTRR